MRRDGPEGVDSLAEEQRRRRKSPLAEGYGLAGLADQRFPEMKTFVEGIVHEGVTLLAGAPKIGKSCMATQVALACVTSGLCFGTQKTEPTEVGLLALDGDSPRSMQWRLTRMLGIANPWPEGVTIFHWWTTGAQGIEDLTELRTRYPQMDLVVVDVLERIREPTRGRDRESYHADYRALAGLTDLHAKTGLSSLVLHHTRKGAAPDDQLEAISGTTGLSGAATAALVLRADTDGMMTLHGRHRHGPTTDLVMEFDESNLSWLVVGDRKDIQASAVRNDIYRLLDDAQAEMTPKQIAAALGRNDSTVRTILARMVTDLVVQKRDYGRYAHPLTPRRKHRP
jgi:AAA domain